MNAPYNYTKTKFMTMKFIIFNRRLLFIQPKHSQYSISTTIWSLLVFLFCGLSPQVFAGETGEKMEIEKPFNHTLSLINSSPSLCSGTSGSITLNGGGNWSNESVRVVISSSSTFSSPIVVGSYSFGSSFNGGFTNQSINITIPSSTPNGTYFLRAERFPDITHGSAVVVSNSVNIEVTAATRYYRDFDEDGFGNPNDFVDACDQPAGYILNAGDCDDADGLVWQSATLYVDGDMDGYTTGTGETVCYGAEIPSGYREEPSEDEDCDDENEDVWQSATLFVDVDGDGYTVGTGVTVCYGAEIPSGYSATKSGTDDCDDEDKDIWQSATLFVDDDEDGYTIGSGVTVCYGASIPSGYTATQSGTDDCDDENEDVHTAPTAVITNGTQTVQYSDAITSMVITAISTPAATISFQHKLGSGSWNAGLPAGLQVTGSASPWTVSGNMNVETGLYTIEITLNNGCITTQEVTITVIKEDVTIHYSGNSYFSTSSPTSNTATIALSATVVDDADGSSQRGDVRNAKVDFINMNGSDISGLDEGLNVGLVNPSDETVGNSTLSCVAALSNQVAASGGTTYCIKVQVSGDYYKPAYDQETITVVVPGSDFVTGGGSIILTHPAGEYAGDVGSKTNFGFNMKWNSSGKNLAGQITVLFRRWETTTRMFEGSLTDFTGWHIYKIKSNAINSMAIVNVNIDGEAFKKAVLSTKANLTREAPDGFIESLGGNLDLSMDVLENQEVTNGSKDRISIILRRPSTKNSGGAVLFASNWNGTRAVDQQIKGGKINVRSASSINTSKVMLVSSEMIQSTLALKALPNPSSSYFTIQISGDAKERAQMIISDIMGRTVEARDVVPGQSVQVGSKFMTGVYFVEVIQGTERKQLKLVKY
jgi:hypothetical protein